MIEIVNSSVLTKLLAALFLFICLTTGMIIVFVYVCIYRTDPPQYITGIIYAGLAASINILGVHMGAVTASSGQKQLIEAMPALPPITKIEGTEHAPTI